MPRLVQTQKIFVKLLLPVKNTTALQGELIFTAISKFLDKIKLSLCIILHIVLLLSRNVSIHLGPFTWRQITGW